MHVGQISFCNGTGYNVKSDEDKERISADLKSLGISVLARQYEKFGTEFSAKAIQANPHLLSLRTHGNPYYLYLTKVNGVCQCIFVDKKIQQGYFQPRMILTKLWFDADLFSGTIFDGEMVRCQDVKGEREEVYWTFIINDLIVDRGVPLSNVNFVRRINRVYEMLSTQFLVDGMDACKVQVKKYFKYDQLDAMVSSFMKTLPYPIRGIIFKSLFLKFRDILFEFRNEQEIQQGKEHMRSQRTKLADGFRVDTMSPKFNQKTKPDTKLNVVQKRDRKNPRQKSPTRTQTQSQTQTESKPKTDLIRSFDVRKTNLPDVYELVDKVHDKKELACIPDLTTSKEMRKLFETIGVAKSIPIRCMLHDKFKKWVPMTGGCVGVR
ncbi:hypothetical protein TSOC_000463 [Tetrabaena socialis]|uniref:mRNA capping enzyme adenylation domain-containing protein n=1 Tax=Tetrabaena socialis TaxID=47790 RepID=A0A2J8AJA0_9CHLO|nr:hypothetical protein TSOC_000463 [Tetrabaena socialis]|eukprot:PNH12597.1 hypothetical protein TSOC_000463 [Tetrabaena socialis]